MNIVTPLPELRLATRQDVVMSVGQISSTEQVQQLLPDGARPSWQSRCINGLLRLLPIKKRTASAAAVQEHVRRWHCGRRLMNRRVWVAASR